MTLRARDLIATVLVALIAVPYIGYLVNGSAPLIQDARGMSAVGLILGTAAFLVLRSGDSFDELGKTEVAIAAVSLALGLVALIFAEAAVAELLLALFMGSILVVYAVELMDHTGVLHGHHPTGAAR